MGSTTKRCLGVGLLLCSAGCRGEQTAPTPATTPSTGPASAAIPAPLTSAPRPSTPTSGATAATGAAPTGATQWSFDADKAGAAPVGFSFARTGGGRAGAWVVRPESDAPSAPHVLAQTDADAADDRFPVAFVSDLSLRDVDLAVRCKPVSGSVDQACGLVFRLKDASNYYVTRANALENNVRLYFVKDGRRQQIATWNGKVTPNAWHAYRVVAQGDHLEVYWEGTRVIDHHDKTFSDAGKLGVWTKADSVTYFDDLSVKPAG